MRRFCVGIVLCLVGVGLALSVPRAQAQSYGPDVTTTGAAYSCGDFSGKPNTAAFDNSTGTSWGSSQTGTAVNGNACIGQHFAGAYDIRQISIKQGGHDQRISSAYWQYSDDGSTWHTITVLSLPDDGNVNVFSALPVVGGHLWWRLVANSNAYGTGEIWASVEIEMMEAVGNPTATPAPTSTAPSATPTITLTPSATPSPTPNYFVEVTSTLTSPMRLERSATLGDSSLLICGGVLGVIGLLILGLLFWRGTRA